LTHVTRIFEKSLFTETAPRRPGRDAAPGFLLRDRACGRAHGGFLVFS
jgi:hypothetical protein